MTTTEIGIANAKAVLVPDDFEDVLHILTDLGGFVNDGLI